MTDTIPRPLVFRCYFKQLGEGSPYRFIFEDDFIMTEARTRQPLEGFPQYQKHRVLLHGLKWEEIWLDVQRDIFYVADYHLDTIEQTTEHLADIMPPIQSLMATIYDVNQHMHILETLVKNTTVRDYIIHINTYTHFAGYNFDSELEWYHPPETEVPEDRVPVWWTLVLKDDRNVTWRDPFWGDVARRLEKDFKEGNGRPAMKLFVTDVRSRVLLESSDESAKSAET